MARVAAVEARVRWFNQAENQVTTPGQLERPYRENIETLLARIKRYMGSFAINRKPEQQPFMD